MTGWNFAVRSQRRRVALAAAMALVLGATLAFTHGVVDPDGTVEAGPIEITRSQAGPLGAVTVLGDSVLLGSAAFAPTLPDQLVASGWGPIRMRAGEGFSSGKFPVNPLVRVSYWIETWRAQGWDAPNVIINLGANDSGLCNVSLQCARESILHVVNTLGPGHRVWWPQITKLRPEQMSNWNLALSQIAGEREDFFTWDWPTVMVTEGYDSHDFIHLSPASYRKRSARMAEEFTAVLASARRVGGDAALPSATSAPSTYQPLSPARVVDTRDGRPGRRPARSTFAVDFGNRLPTGTTAVAINVTAAEPASDGYLTAAPCGSPTQGSTVNYTAGQSRGAMTITPLGTGDDICVYAHTATDVVVDLQGAFVAGDGAAGFTPLAAPRRLADTRDTGRARTLTIATPPGASGVAVNLTATGAVARGNLRAYPCDATPPVVSSVNFRPGESIAGSAFVPTSAKGTICVTASTNTDVVVDLTGTFDPSSGLSFVAVTPTRMLDTRSGVGGWSPIHGSGQTLDVRVAPATAEAVTGTLTMIRPLRRGYLTGHGCATMPPTSSVNGSIGIVLANSVTTGVSNTGRLCVFAQATTNTVFDTTGWWIP